MKIRQRDREFEGTPEEWELVKHDWSAPGWVEPARPAAKPTVELPPQVPTLSSQEQHEVVVRALTRRPLPQTMLKVFRALLESSDGVTTAEFAKLLDLSRAQIAGVFGAFGRRLSHTDGFPEGNAEGWIATNTWNGIDRRYVLTPLGRATLQDKRVKLG